MRKLLAAIGIVLALIAPAFSIGVQFQLSAASPLIPSGPVTITANGQTVSNLDIVANCTGIDVGGFDNVTIRYVRITKNVSCGTSDAFGITTLGADNLTLEYVEVIDAGAPPRGAQPSTNKQCVRIANGANFVASNITVYDCSSGITMSVVNNTTLDSIECHNMRGPYPRGQCVQWNQGTGVHALTNASDEAIPGTAWNEDSFNVYATPNITIDTVTIPMGSDGQSGRGVVVEQFGSFNVLVNNVEAFWTYNGVYGGFEVTPTITFTNMRVSGYQLYGSRGIAGSSNLGATLPAQVVTGAGVDFVTATVVSGIYQKLPSVSPDGVILLPGDYNIWYNQTNQGTGSVTASSWTPTISVIRNDFPWRDFSAPPKIELPVRIGSYWLDGVFGTSLVNGAVLGVLPGVYSNDPTSYAWQWTKNGTPVSGATEISFPLSGMVSNDNICVQEVASNAAGSAATATACVRFP